MILRPNKRAVGTFPHRRDTEKALHELRDSGFAMDRVSVIARDSETPGRIGQAEVHDHDHGNKADDGAKAGALTGGALGGLTGLLVGLGALAIPGIGPIMLAGATATAVATTLAGGAIGAAAGGLIGSLIGLGIPEEHARTYNERVSKGHYLVIIDGTDDEIRNAHRLLDRRGIEDWNVFDIPDSEYRERTPEAVVTPERHDYRAIGIFPRRRDADDALDELIRAGFPLHQINLVGRDYDHHPNRHRFQVHNRFDNGFLGFLGDRNRFFNDRYDRGDYLVIVEGSPEEIRRAETLLSRRGIQEWAIFKRPEHDRHQEHFTTFSEPRSDSELPNYKHGVGIFSTRREAEYALTELRNAEFPMNHVSVVAHDSDQMNRIPDINRMNRVDNYAGLGIFEDRAKRYHDHVGQGHYLVIVRGTDNDLRQVQSILNRQGIQEFGIYDPTAVNYSSSNNYTAQRLETDAEHARVVSRDPKVKIVDHRDDRL
ncbi:general stress protein [Capilliphycus salinus ALCB114379]|uniref:general stress protein n=1 Tax=Capilliphycus salinus TaxID=2768948 RepID=UPI0039A4E214